MTQERLKELLNYDPKTGLFSWIARPARRVKIGEIVGYVHKQTGYRIIGLEQKRYKAHRLVWLYVHGTMPCEELDHRNGIRSDNRIVNLRLASHSQNNANRKSRQLKGVTFQAGKWMAQITKAGTYFYLGRFTTKQDAHNAYMSAAEKLFGEFARPL